MVLVPTNNKTWVVKSAGSILGPFTHEEVEAELRSKRIVVIDEIKTSQGRWKFIRECPDFQDLIMTLRDEQLTGHDDSSLTQTGFTQSVTDTHVMDQQTVTSPSAVVDAKKPKAPPAKYGYSSDQKLQVNLNNEKRRVATIAWVVVVLVIGAGVFAYTTMNGKKPKASGYKEALRRARIEKSLGNYEASLDYFRKAFAFKMPTASGELETIPLILLTEKQDVQVQRSLERMISAGNLDEVSNLEAEQLLALTFLRQGQWNEAENRYRKILAKYPSNETAEVNLLEISILQSRNLSKVYEDLTRLLKEGFREQTLVLYRALVALQLFDAGKNSENLERAVQDIERYQSKYLDYRPESLLIQAALYKKMKNTGALEKSLRDLMVTDPDLTLKHRRDYLLHQEVFRWSYLAKLCNQILENSPKTLPYAGLSAICAYQQGDLKSAIDLVDKARTQFSGEPILVGLYSFLLLKAARDEEAYAVFQIPGARDFELALSLHAQQCLKRGDSNCAEADYKALEKMNPKSIEASTGLAKLALDGGRTDSAKDWIKRGLMVSEDYRPLLAVERQMNEP